MSKLSTHITVAAPADAVWDVIGRRFDRIGEWATAIPASTPLAQPVGPASLDAPVAGRVCTTNVLLVPHVTEKILAYDEANRSLTYEATGLPAFVSTARNTWTVTPLGERLTRVTIQAQFDTRGLLGRIARWAILVQTAWSSRRLSEDLRHYVEHGTPSPRKARQLERTQRRSSAR